MYIKLCINEEIVTIPGCLGGLAIKLVESPEIIEVLPANISANVRENIQSTSTTASQANNFVLSKYDYYLDCGMAKLEMIEKALVLLDNVHEKTLVQFAGPYYPNINPLVRCLEKALDQVMKTSAPVSTLFKPAQTSDALVSSSLALEHNNPMPRLHV